MILDDHVTFRLVWTTGGATNSSPRHVDAGIALCNGIVSEGHIADARSDIDASKRTIGKIAAFHCHGYNVTDLDVIVSWIR